MAGTPTPEELEVWARVQAILRRSQAPESTSLPAASSALPSTPVGPTGTASPSVSTSTPVGFTGTPCSLALTSAPVVGTDGASPSTLKTPTKKNKGRPRKHSASSPREGPAKRPKVSKKEVEELNAMITEYKFSVRKYAEHIKNWNPDFVDPDDPKTIITELDRSKTDVQSSHLGWKSAKDSADEMAVFVTKGRTWNEARMTRKDDKIPFVAKSLELRAAMYYEPQGSPPRRLVKLFTPGQLGFLFRGGKPPLFWEGARLDDDEFRRKFMDDRPYEVRAVLLDFDVLMDLIRRVPLSRMAVTDHKVSQEEREAFRRPVIDWGVQDEPELAAQELGTTIDNQQEVAQLEKQKDANQADNQLMPTMPVLSDINATHPSKDNATLYEGQANVPDQQSIPIFGGAHRLSSAAEFPQPPAQMHSLRRNLEHQKGLGMQPPKSQGPDKLLMAQNSKAPISTPVALDEYPHPRPEVRKAVTSLSGEVGPGLGMAGRRLNEPIRANPTQATGLYNPNRAAARGVAWAMLKEAEREQLRQAEETKKRVKRDDEMRDELIENLNTRLVKARRALDAVEQEYNKLATRCNTNTDLLTEFIDKQHDLEEQVAYDKKQMVEVKRQIAAINTRLDAVVSQRQNFRDLEQKVATLSSRLDEKSREIEELKARTPIDKQSTPATEADFHRRIAELEWIKRDLERKLKERE